MIKFFHIDNILDSNIISFSESKKELSIKEIDSLKRVKLFEFQLPYSSYANENKDFLATILINLLADYRIHFYLIEKTAKQKARSRSLKKLLYPYKKHLLSSNIYEEEVLLEGDKTLIYSIVELSVDNLQFVVENLVDSRLSFIRVDKNEFEKTNLSISELIQKTPLKKGDLFDLNKLRLLDFVISDYSSVINMHMDGSDKYYLRFFFQNQGHADYIKDLSDLFRIREMNV
ncbi:MAG: hypothetical protein DA408_08595 [Bacteroidetes bacterium]|nr:MAG: hypothetical protein C7N36_00150 [Bacteroidota bacterium]PTM12904.1 MAG: hypothetical protein DA408_08595 [Bacteroidota bacterium]